MTARFTGGFLFMTMLYFGSNIYLGWHFWRCIKRKFQCQRTLYILLWAVLAVLPLLGRAAVHWPVRWCSDALILSGDLWMGAALYMLLLWLFIDAVNMLLRLGGDKCCSIIRPDSLKSGMAVVAITVLLVSYGMVNARDVQVQKYDIAVNKQAGDVAVLKVVAVSDIHAGTVLDRQRIAGLVDLINGQYPDIILLMGDIVDEDVDYVDRYGILQPLSGLKAKYGSYACLGNHDYYGGKPQRIIDMLSAAGVNVLRDATQNINGSFYVAGRDDYSRQRATGNKRLPLTTVLSGVDMAKPVLVLDHQPIDLAESEAAGVDVQFSGHTHGGQLFPINIITHFMYAQDHGYLHHGLWQMLVTAGFGSWGPPLRIGSNPEIMDVTIHFTAP